MVLGSKGRWWQLKDFWNFHPDLWGNDSQFDEHIFQMGWFNHQRGKDVGPKERNKLFRGEMTEMTDPTSETHIFGHSIFRAPNHFRVSLLFGDHLVNPPIKNNKKKVTGWTSRAFLELTSLDYLEDHPS